MESMFMWSKDPLKVTCGKEDDFESQILLLITQDT